MSCLRDYLAHLFTPHCPELFMACFWMQKAAQQGFSGRRAESCAICMRGWRVVLK